jgi:hypothetical protein
MPINNNVLIRGIPGPDNWPGTDFAAWCPARVTWMNPARFIGGVPSSSGRVKFSAEE